MPVDINRAPGDVRRLGCVQLIGREETVGFMRVSEVMCASDDIIRQAAEGDGHERRMKAVGEIPRRKEGLEMLSLTVKVPRTESAPVRAVASTVARSRYSVPLQ